MTENEAKLEQQYLRGQQAQELLEHPLMAEALTAIRADLYEKFSRTKTGESDMREELWRKQQTVDWFESYLKNVLTTGRLAHETLLQRAKRALRRA